MRRTRSLALTALLLATLGMPRAWGQGTTKTETSLFGGAARLTDVVQTDASDQVVLSYHLLQIDLRNAGVSFLATPSNGSEPGLTTKQTTSEFAAATGVQVAINANFFSSSDDTVGHADSLGGLSMTGGQVVSPFSPSFPGIAFGPDGSVSYFTDTAPSLSSVDVAVSGTYRLIADGVVKTTGYDLPTAQNSRTAIGTDQANDTLFLLTVDANFLGLPGTTYVETANILQSYGVFNAVNLDGGRSSTMVVADPSVRLVNVPKFFGVERPVGNNLGIFIRPVPEPGALLLLVAGVPVAMLARRQRRGVA